MTELATDPNFKPFGAIHLTIIAATIGLAIGLPWLAIHLFPDAVDLWFGRLWISAISFSVIYWTVNKVRSGRFQKEVDLPLDICNLLGLLVVVFMWRPNIVAYEPIYYITVTGTFQAILTPDFREDTDWTTVMKYWAVHSGLVIYAIYATAAYDFRPTLGGIVVTFWVSQIYLIVAFILNWLVGGNYVYLRHKPPNRTLVDYLGPWPVYILFVDLLLLIGYFIVYQITYLIV